MNIDQFPSNLIEFEQMFRDESACEEYLARVRWPNGFVCHCGAGGWRLSSRPLMECRNGHQTSIKAGTVFHGSKKPLRLWFTAIFLMTAQKDGISAKSLQRLLGFGSYETAWIWLHKLRDFMVLPRRTRLEGAVEQDETYGGGQVREKAAGRGWGHPLVACAVEIHADSLGRTRLAVCENASVKSLCSFVTENVAKGARVETDGWQSYNTLAELGFDHRRHVSKTKDGLLPGVHRVISLLSRWLLGTHQGGVQPRHLQRYLDEFTFRFNRRRSTHPGRLFEKLAAVLVTARPYTSRVT